MPQNVNLTISLTGDLSKKVGSPPKTVIDWLSQFEIENRIAANNSLNPFTRIKLNARADAFRDALDLLKRVIGKTR